MYEIEYYRKPNGEKPARTYLETLGVKLKAKSKYMIDLLAREGSGMREPESKHLEDGIFELRTQFGSDSGRVLFFFYIGKKIVLTHGFLKKTEKTPRKEILKAKRYRDDYLKHNEGSNNDEERV